MKHLGSFLLSAAFLCGTAAAAAAGAAPPASPAASVPEPGRAVARALAEGDRAAKAGAWTEAVRAYQSLLEAGPADLCAVGAEHFAGARHIARLRLRALPPEGRRACRALYDPIVRPIWEHGQRSRDDAALTQLTRLYSASTYGPLAWDLLGELAWERGQPSRALDAFRAAVDWSVGGEAGERVRVKIAVCLARLGRLSEAADILRAAGGSPILNTQSSMLNDQVRKRPTQPAPRGFFSYLDIEDWILDIEHWTSLFGWLRSVAGPGRWQAELPAGAVRRTWQCALWQPIFGVEPQTRARPWGFLLPIVAEGLVIGPAQGGLEARDELTGRPLWRVDAPPAYSTAAALWLDEAGGPLAVAAGQGRVYLIAPETVPGGGASSTRHRIHALDAATGRTLRVLGTPNSLPKVSHLREGMPGTLVPEDSAEYPPEGAIREWPSGGTGLKPSGGRAEDDGLLDRLSFCAAPVECDGIVYAAAYLDGTYSDFHALAFDAATGRLLWRTYLFTAECPPSRCIGPPHASPLTLADGFLYFASNSGAVACLDVREGSVAWVRLYERTGSFWRRGGGRPLGAWPGWRNPPLVHRGVVLAVPCDAATILGLDATTGERRWERPRGDHVFLFGASLGVAVLAGREVEAIETSTGRTLWSRGPREGVDPRGLGVLRDDAVFCPTARGVLELDPATGRERGLRLAASGHYVRGNAVELTAGPEILSCYAAPSRVAKRERERISADPEAIEPRYRLAMALRLDEHEEQAAAELRSALPLCRGRARLLPSRDERDPAEPLAGRLREAAWELFQELGRRAEAKGQLAEASAQYAEAAEATLEPTRRIQAKLGLASCLRARGDWRGLVGLYDGLIERDGDVVVPVAAGVSCAASALAEREIGQVLAQHGRNAYGPFEEAARKRIGPEDGGWRARVADAARRYPNSLAVRDAIARLAEQAMRRGDAAEAAQHYAACLRWANTASATVGLPDRAVDSTLPDTAGQASRGTDPDLMLRLVECYEQLGDLASARPLLRRLAALPAERTGTLFPPAERIAIAAFARERLQGGRYRADGGDEAMCPLSGVRLPIVRRWIAKEPGLVPIWIEEAGSRPDGVVFARNWTALFCLDAATGIERWRVALRDEPLMEQSRTARLHAGLLFVYGGKAIHALEPKSGTLRWSLDLGPNSAAESSRRAWGNSFHGIQPMLPAFRFEGNQIAVATLDGRLLGLDPATGARRWETRLPGKPCSTLHRIGDRLAIATLPECQTVLADPVSGHVVQIARVLDHEPLGGAFWADDALLVADGDRVIGFDPAEARRLWTFVPRRKGAIAIEQFGPRAVAVSSGGGLYLLDAATGQLQAERNTSPMSAYLRAGSDLLLFCERTVEESRRLSIEAYSGSDLGHLWYTAQPLSDVSDATATEQDCLVCVRRYAREAGAFRRDVLVFGRRTGAALGVLPTAEFDPHLLTPFVPAPHHLLATVHCVIDKVPGQHLVAFGTGEGKAPAEPAQGDALLQALREGRIAPADRIALAERHARRRAFDEAFDVLAGGLSDGRLSDRDYLSLGGAMASLRRQAILARSPEIAVEPIEAGVPAVLALDEVRDFEVAAPGNSAVVVRPSGAETKPATEWRATPDRWRGPDDLSASIQLAYSRIAPAALAIRAIVRDDIHCPGAPGRGDRLEVLLARWQEARQQWGDSDIGLGLACSPAIRPEGRTTDEPWVWFLGNRRLAADLRQSIRCTAERDEAQKTTTYQLLIPWRVIGHFVPNAGATIDFAIAIHDDDGRGPKGALRWGLFEPGLTGHLRLKGD